MPAVRAVVTTLVVVVALAACRVAQPSPAPDGAGAPAVTSVLAARAAAVIAADRSALAATLATGADAALTDLAERLAGLPISSWAYTVRSSTPGPGAGEVDVTARLDYRLTADPAGLSPASALRSMVLLPDPARPGSLLVRSDRPAGAWLPWDVGPVGWTTGTGAAVMDVRAQPSVATDRALLAGGRAAAATVTSVWGTGWRRLPVLVATQGAEQLAELTGRSPADVAGLVAVTTTDRVFVDVDAWQALPAAGRQVILGHEMTHLATRAAADPNVPLWLEGGFADYVGLRGSGLPVRTVAAALLGPVRAGAPVPAALPPDADFAAAGTAVSRAYAGAWLACRLIAASGGTAGLVAVYRATSAGDHDPDTNVDAALRAVTGEGTAGWTARWRAWVAGVASRRAAA